MSARVLAHTPSLKGPGPALLFPFAFVGLAATLVLSCADSPTEMRIYVVAGLTYNDHRN